MFVFIQYNRSGHYMVYTGILLDMTDCTCHYNFCVSIVFASHFITATQSAFSPIQYRNTVYYYYCCCCFFSLMSLILHYNVSGLFYQDETSKASRLKRRRYSLPSRLRGLRKRREFPSGVRGGAAAEKIIWCFLTVPGDLCTAKNRLPRPRPFWSIFSFLCLVFLSLDPAAKFDVCSFILTGDNRGVPKFKSRSRDLGHAPFGPIFHFFV